MQARRLIERGLPGRRERRYQSENFFEEQRRMGWQEQQEAQEKEGERMPLLGSVIANPVRQQNIIPENVNKKNIGWWRYFEKRMFLIGIGTLLAIISAVMNADIFEASMALTWSAEILGVIAVLCISSFFIMETQMVKNKTKILENEIRDKNCDQIKIIEERYGKFGHASLVISTQTMNILNIGISTGASIAGLVLSEKVKALHWVKLLLLLVPIIETSTRLLNYLTLKIFGNRDNDLAKSLADSSKAEVSKNQEIQFQARIDELQAQKQQLEKQIAQIKQVIAAPFGAPRAAVAKRSAGGAKVALPLAALKEEAESTQWDDSKEKDNGAGIRLSA